MRKRRLGSILISAALIVILAVFLINLREGSSKAPADAVTLSEIMISNKGSVPDNLGGYPDYIELHNGSTEKADISGYGLSDNADKPSRWRFPSVTIEPGGYLLVYASGLDKNADGEYHTNFRLRAEGESVLLYNAKGQLLDHVS